MSYPLIFSAPTAPPPTPVDLWQGMSLTWTGPDGSEWDLSDEGSGVVLAAGVEGLHFPRIQRFTSSSRTIPGHRLRGFRPLAREVFWPLLIWGDTSDAWLERHNAFMSTIHPTDAGTWRVHSGKEERTLKLTGVFDDPHVFDRDPRLFGWQHFGVTLEAAQPYWVGKAVTRGPWRDDSSQPFFPGPPFRISDISQATIPNLGSVESYGVWWLDGPLADIRVGVGDARILVPFDLVEGQTLRIDTDPRAATASLGPTTESRGDFVGQDATRQLGLQQYAAVPPGRSVDLFVQFSGAGAVLFELTPLHLRAF